jgi:hypothetical protein
MGACAGTVVIAAGTSGAGERFARSARTSAFVFPAAASTSSR